MFAISTQNSSVCEFLKALVRLQCIYAQLNDVDFSNSARSMSEMPSSATPPLRRTVPRDRRSFHYLK